MRHDGTKWRRAVPAVALIAVVVNTRVLSSWVWDQIAAHPTLDKVRELQAAHPTLISKDNPTNIFFFFEVRTTTPGS